MRNLATSRKSASNLLFIDLRFSKIYFIFSIRNKRDNVLDKIFKIVKDEIESIINQL